LFVVCCCLLLLLLFVVVCCCCCCCFVVVFMFRIYSQTMPLKRIRPRGKFLST
jgi:hypothetical protein